MVDGADVVFSAYSFLFGWQLWVLYSSGFCMPCLMCKSPGRMVDGWTAWFSHKWMPMPQHFVAFLQTSIKVQFRVSFFSQNFYQRPIEECHKDVACIHPSDMTKPSESHLTECCMHTAHVCAFQHFCVGDLVLTLDMQDSLQASHVEAVEFPFGPSILECLKSMILCHRWGCRPCWRDRGPLSEVRVQFQAGSIWPLLPPLQFCGWAMCRLRVSLRWLQSFHG